MDDFVSMVRLELYSFGRFYVAVSAGFIDSNNQN